MQNIMHEEELDHLNIALHLGINPARAAFYVYVQHVSYRKIIDDADVYQPYQIYSEKDLIIKKQIKTS